MASCRAFRPDGKPCRAGAIQSEEYCFWHSREHAEEAAEARKLGGRRRRREKITAGAYDFEGLETVAQIRRLLEIAVTDTLGLENSVARSRALAYLAQVALRALETGEFEERLRSLEQAIQPESRREGMGKRWVRFLNGSRNSMAP
jgi:hypothetical protein